MLTCARCFAVGTEAKNPIIKQLKNPFGDEGFRMKRYLDDGTEVSPCLHHASLHLIQALAHRCVY
jgi:hypothetical protein